MRITTAVPEIADIEQLPTKAITELFRGLSCGDMQLIGMLLPVGLGTLDRDFIYGTGPEHDVSATDSFSAYTEVKTTANEYLRHSDQNG